MRIRKKKWAMPELEVCPFFIQDPVQYRGKWSTAFAKEAPLYLELGCGKGGFAGQCAAENEDINLLAIDIKSDMLGVARRNIVKIYEEKGREINNLLLSAYNVEHIENIIAPEDKVERIYINFCNPWPRAKHNKRRHTYPIKLEKYKNFLVSGAEIRFKTDDLPLFQDSLAYFEKCGYEITYKTYDLHNSGFEGNILTEHEIMFSSEGIKINYCTAVRK